MTRIFGSPSAVLRALCGVWLLCALAGSVVHAQPPQRGNRPLLRGNLPPREDGEGPNVSPAEIQRMFDAVALVQAQDDLKLSDDQYVRFLARFKALQEVRRRSQVERVRMIQDLRRLSAPEARVDEAQLRDRIRALQDLEAQTAADLRKAYDGVDQILDVRQQAKFRVFEEQMERRKIELVTRARQANRGNNRPPPELGRRGQP